MNFFDFHKNTYYKTILKISAAKLQKSLEFTIQTGKILFFLQKNLSVSKIIPTFAPRKRY
jgi:hypothetical protein